MQPEGSCLAKPTSLPPQWHSSAKPKSLPSQLPAHTSFQQEGRRRFHPDPVLDGAAAIAGEIAQDLLLTKQWSHAPCFEAQSLRNLKNISGELPPSPPPGVPWKAKKVPKRLCS